MPKRKIKKKVLPKKKKKVVRKRQTTAKKKVIKSRKKNVIRPKKKINFLNPLWMGLLLLLLAVFLKLDLSNPLPLTSAEIIKNYDQRVDFTSLPTKIEIPRLEVSLAVKQTLIEDGRWGISKETASHLLTSAAPGGKGNIIIYGHNKSGQFRGLDKTGLGDLIRLETNDGRTYVYKISAKKVVQPDEIEFLLPTQNEILTLYTCTGFADSKRLVVQASPVLANIRLTSLK